MKFNIIFLKFIWETFFFFFFFYMWETIETLYYETIEAMSNRKGKN